MERLVKYLLIVNLILAMNSFGQIYKVDDFGAVGDGVTNDRDAIQRALDTIKVKGGELQFTSGKTYLLRDTNGGSVGCGLALYRFEKPATITSTGEEKATLKVASGVPVIWGNWIFRLYDSKDLTISNLRFDGNRDGRQPAEKSGNYLLQIERRCDGLRLENLHVINGVVDNVYIEGYPDDDPTTFMRDFEMHDCVVENAYRNNMSVIRGLNFKIIGCEFNGANGTAPEAGIDFEPNPGGDDLGYVNMLVEGCTFKDNKRHGILLTDIETESGYSRIQNNIFDNCGLLIASEYNVVRNNIFINMDHMPIFGGNDEAFDGIVYFHVNRESNYNKVYNNYFYNNPTPPEMHLFNFMSNAGIENEVYNNYEFNNSIAGFVNDATDQIVYGNVSLNTIEMGYWNFDMGFVSDTTVLDLSDFGQTGQLHGNPTVIGGKFNEALDFSPDNKYIEIPIKKNLNIEMNLTISAWVNWNGTNSESEQVIVGRNNDWRFGIDNSGKVGFYAPKINDSSYIAGRTTTEEAIPTGEWTLLTMTYDGMRTKIYINGEEKANELGYGRLDTSSTKIYIASMFENDKSFNGSIDDVRLYNYPLSAEEIMDLYNAVNHNDQAEPEGSGTEDDPYQIATFQNLSWLAQSADKWDAHYVQTADIDMSVTATWDDADDNGDGDKYNDSNDRLEFGNNEGWSPIGNATTKFSGVYDGGGHIIKGISITNRSTSGNGFFGEIENGVVKNIGLTGINIQGNSVVGGMAASCSGASILKSFTKGNVVCVDGGTVGYDYGGFVGTAQANTGIEECYSEADIKGAASNSERVGGFAGSVNSSTVSKCYSLGDVDSVGASSAGFIGEVSGTSVIEHCYSIGMTDNGSTDKGFAGAVGSGTPTFTSNFFDSENSGHTSSIGAAAKTTDEMISEVTFTDAGWDFTNIWEVKSNYPNLLENSNSRLEKGIDYKPMEAPEGSGTEADPFKISSLSDLSWLAQVDSVWDKYFIQTADIDASETATWDDSDDDYDGNKYNDPNDLTTEGTNDGFSPIGNGSVKFFGYYDGNDYSVRNIVIKRPNSTYIGFFGRIETLYNAQSTIKNLGLYRAKIEGKGIIGGFVGENYGVEITNCYVEDGDIVSSASTGYIGGFIGSNNRVEAIISKCYSNVHVTSSGSGKYVGGFIGRNRSGGVISRCYSRGVVESAGDKVGGFIGQNASSEVSNCYSTASVSSGGSGASFGGFCGAVYDATIENCYSIGANSSDNTKGFLGAKGGIGNVFNSNYLDTLASGCNQTAVPEAASGKTTLEMKTQSTYVGWDFNDVWSIEGDNYPLLNGLTVSVKDNERILLPAEYTLGQNYPNPFNPTTTIKFSLKEAGMTKLEVYNTLGQKVKTLLNKNMRAGSYSVVFEARNLPSGVYFYKLQSNNEIKIKKMLLLK